MRANVLTDKALTKHAGQFAWLSIDTDKPENAAFVDKYPIEGWPAFLMIDPATEKIALHWYGTATVAQLEKLLEDGQRAIRGGGNPAESALARADRLTGEKKHAEAAKAYAQALALGGRDWPRRYRVIESLTMAENSAQNSQACAETAAREAPGMPRGPSFANTVWFGLQCALGALSKAAWAADAAETLRPLAVEAVALPGVLADDRSGLYQELVELKVQQKDEAGAAQLAEEWLAFLEGEAAKAPNAEARAAFDSLRISAARVLKAPGRVIPALEASERDLPNDYNPALRLASLYRDAGRLDDALAASERAIAKAYGAPKLGAYSVRAGILEKQGDKAGARAAIAGGLGFAATLPRNASVDRRAEMLRKQLAALQ